MEIGGIQKTTLIDYPGKIATTVFIIGCNFRCPFCYSSELVLPAKIKNQPRISRADFFDFLRERRELLDGVVICGGEPTIHQELPDFVKEIKRLGFLVKLDTNGSKPEMLEKLIKNELLDYIAMDVKGPKEKYDFFSGTNDNIDINGIEKSLNILKKEVIEYEFRTTIAPGLSKEDILKIVKWIGPAKRYFLQEVKLDKEIVNPQIKTLPFLSRIEIEKIVREIKSQFKVCKVR